MHLAGPLSALLDRVLQGEGTPSLRVPVGTPTDLRTLLAAPSAFSCVAEGDWSSEAEALRPLAAMRDPVADDHAAWLLAVMHLAGGRAIEHDDALPASDKRTLTGEGRAWLAAQSIEHAPTNSHRSKILSALGAPA